MILRYVTKVTKILEECDKAREEFLQVTKNLDEYVKHETERKCFNAFLAGAIIATIIFSSVIYVYSSDYGKFVSQLMKGGY